MMAKPAAIESVEDYLVRVGEPYAAIVAALRLVILDTSSEIAEHIKWNSPAYYYSGEMKPFDPKKYLRDLVVMNKQKNYVLLVFPTGARINDKKGLLEGDYADGRRMMKFTSADDVKSRKKDLQFVINEWMKGIEK